MSITLILNTVTKKTHPPKDGWIHVTLTLEKGYSPSLDDLEKLLVFGSDPAKHDIVVASLRGRILRGCYRPKTA